MAGYSGTPLVKKLGSKAGHRVALCGEPVDFLDHLGPLPDQAIVVKRATVALDVIMCFVDSRAGLNAALSKSKRLLKSDGALWLCWPKRASGRPTDLGEGAMRETGLGAGLVDI